MQIKKVFRQERKFLISGEQYYRFSRQFAELFKEDSHNGKDGYMVRSLYFDTLGNKDFEEKLAGVECRRKMRLRQKIFWSSNNESVACCLRQLI